MNHERAVKQSWGILGRFLELNYLLDDKGLTEDTSLEFNLLETEIIRALTIYVEEQYE